MKKYLLFLRYPRTVFFLIAIFSFSYFLSSSFLIPKNNIKLSASTPEEQEILSKIFGPSAQATDVYVSTRVYGDFQTYGIAYSDNYWCDSGATRTYYSNQQGSSTNSAVWYGCYAPTSSLNGKYVATPLFTSGPNSYWCEAGSTAKSYFYDTGDDWATVWYACHSDAPISVVVTPPPPTFSPQPSCTGTSISANFSSTGASWYAVRLADLTSGSLLSDGICDPSSNANETCQWQTGTSLNRTGIAGHTYRMWVHGATANTWASGTYSVATYATDFSCPSVAVPVPPAPPAFTTSCPVPGTSMTSTSFATPGATYYNLRVDSQSTIFTPSFINDPSCSSVNAGDTCINNYNGTSYSGSTTPTYYYDVWVHACNASGCSPSATHNQYSRCFTVCSDNADNDGDGLIDMSDPGCSSPTDNDEYNAPPTFSCTGTTPANANICANDDSGLTANTGRTLVSSCTSGTKCEYVCSIGYVYSGGTCVLAGGGGAPAPTVTLNANPTSLPFGGGTTRLTWSTTNATSCSASGSWSGSKATGNGIWQDIFLSSSGTYTFTLTCSGAGGSDTKSATVTVASGGGGGASADITINGLGTGFESRYTGASSNNTPVDVLTNSSVNVAWTSSGRNYCITALYDGGWRFITGTPGNYSFTAPSTASPASTFQTFCSNTDYGSGFSGYLAFASAADTVGDQISLTVSAPSSYSCTGSIPANATMYSGDNVGLAADTPYSYSSTNTAPLCQYSCNTGSTWNSATSTCTTGPSAASITAIVGCTPSGNCAADPRTTQLCSSQTFTIPDGCSGTMTCPGTRSCDYNWKEVAP